MSIVVFWQGNAAEVDAVESADGDVRFEVYLPDELMNLGSFANLSTALLCASECVGYGVDAQTAAGIDLV